MTISLLAGMILTLLGCAFLFISTRWPRQLKNTILQTLPTLMTVKLEVEEDSDRPHTTPFSAREKPGKQLGELEYGSILRNCGKIEDIGQQLEGSVFFHPETGRPVAIEYSRGVLWVMAGSGAVERLPDGGQEGIDRQRSQT